MRRWTMPSFLAQDAFGAPSGGAALLLRGAAPKPAAANPAPTAQAAQAAPVAPAAQAAPATPAGFTREQHLQAAQMHSDQADKHAALTAPDKTGTKHASARLAHLSAMQAHRKAADNPTHAALAHDLTQNAKASTYDTIAHLAAAQQRPGMR